MSDVLTEQTETKAAFHSVLVIEGERTTDGREFAPGSLSWRTLPLPLMWQPSTDEKHRGSVVVGRIDRIERRDDELHAWGVFDLGSEHGKEAHRLVSEQIMRGISIDAELMEIDREMLMADDGGDPVLYVMEGRIGAATIVAFPAFPSAVIALDGADIPPADENGRPESVIELNRDQDIAICKEECGEDDDCMHNCMEKKAEKYAAEFATRQHTLPTPYAVSNSPWDASSARFDDSQWRRATAGCRGTDAPPKTDCFGPHHEPDGTVSRAGVHAASARFNQVSAPSPAKARARSHLISHYRNDLKEQVPDILTATALVAHAGRTQDPPMEWFVDPELKGPTPLQILRNGRLYGHAFVWNSCHRGFDGKCVTPPRTRSNYAHFMTGFTVTADCDCDSGGIPTGPVVLGTDHASIFAEAGAAARWYSDTGLAVADVAIGEDAWGGWVAGAIRPGVTEAQLRALRGGALSGDWRWIAGSLELVGLLAVNVPGFPVPKLTAGIEGGIQVSLTAAGVPRDEIMKADSTVIDPRSLLSEVLKPKPDA